MQLVSTIVEILSQALQPAQSVAALCFDSQMNEHRYQALKLESDIFGTHVIITETGRPRFQCFPSAKCYGAVKKPGPQ